MNEENDYAGFQSATSGTSEYNQIDFIVRSILAGMATATLVEVKSVTNAGEVAPVGSVDVQPMVAQVDARGQPMPHGTIFNVPYMRMQGGTNAVILDPKVGDIGICVFASRDISSVKVNKAPSNPGSRRQFGMSDALYVGGILNGTPTNYIRFKDNGDIVIKPASTVAVIGNVTVTGTVTATVDVVGGGKSLKTHTHGGVTTGGGTSGPPS